MGLESACAEGRGAVGGGHQNFDLSVLASYEFDIKKFEVHVTSKSTCTPEGKSVSHCETDLLHNQMLAEFHGGDIDPRVAIVATANES